VFNSVEDSYCTSKYIVSSGSDGYWQTIHSVARTFASTHQNRGYRGIIKVSELNAGQGTQWFAFIKEEQ
jgi:hypothetical protein